MIKFTISERIAALSILNAFKGNLETMGVILEDIKQLPITDEEWKKAGRRCFKIIDGKEVVVEAKDAEQMVWDDDKANEKEIKLQKQTVEYLKKAIKEKDEKGEITFQDRALATLNEKL